MTQFTCVDTDGRLWQVDNLLSAEQTQHILNIDWASVSIVTNPGQHFALRHQVAWNEPQIQEAIQWINQCLPVINSAVGTDFIECGGQFWIDLPGFDCAMHTDGELANSMQIYWTVPGPEYGTGFYYHKRSDSLLYQFASRPNTGYIMLNHKDAQGAQPLQWHGMFNPVPEGYIRVSSYWQFK